MKSKLNHLIIPALFIVFMAASESAYGQSMDALKKKYDKQEVYITMRDGVRLFTSIYTPKSKSETHPILLNRTPYNIEPGGVASFNYFTLLYSRYTDDDYIMVFQDVRGKYMI
jgi:predicted acyl esterase